MKHILSIQDLSCVGRCSLTVALPVLSAMGCQCGVLPTAVLSTHTGFPDPYRKALTEDMAAIADHWDRQGIDFDAVSVGYLADPRQAEAVLPILDRFGKTVVVDPAMGDHGKLYGGLTADHIPAMAQVCRKAQVLLPNVTEAALLTGLPYRDNPEEDYLAALTDGMLALGAEAVVITGVDRADGTTGFVGADAGGSFSYRAARISKSLHGTGDLFAAVLTGGLMAGKPVREAATLAARFVERVVAETEAVTPFGPEFEAQLPWLWEQMQ